MPTSVKKQKIICDLIQQNPKLRPTNKKEFRSACEKFLCRELRIAAKRLNSSKVEVFCKNVKNFYLKAGMY